MVCESLTIKNRFNGLPNERVMKDKAYGLYTSSILDYTASVPEGYSEIAQQFIAGKSGNSYLVPEGRLRIPFIVQFSAVPPGL